MEHALSDFCKFCDHLVRPKDCRVYLPDCLLCSVGARCTRCGGLVAYHADGACLFDATRLDLGYWSYDLIRVIQRAVTYTAAPLPLLLEVYGKYLPELYSPPTWTELVRLSASVYGQGPVAWGFLSGERCEVIRALPSFLDPDVRASTWIPFRTESGSVWGSPALVEGLSYFPVQDH